MDKTAKTLCCAECGGTNVQIMAWVDANTHEYKGLVNEFPEEEDCWCEDCEAHVELIKIK